MKVSPASRRAGRSPAGVLRAVRWGLSGVERMFRGSPVTSCQKPRVARRRCQTRPGVR